jgi:hypothetical protein
VAARFGAQEASLYVEGQAGPGLISRAGPFKES